MQEGLAKRIDLPEDNPNLIREMISYCYTTDYKDIRIAMGPEHASINPLRFHAGMYAMAEKFDLKNLKKLAEKKFFAFLEMEPRVRRVGKTLSVLEAIVFIYSTTPKNDRGLRDLVVGHVAQHWYAFLALQQFKTFMAANTDFIIEVIKAKELVCSRCQEHAAWEEERDSLSSHNSNDGW